MYCLHSLSLITIFGVVSIIDATFQSAGAKGLLICNNEPAGGIQIKLYDVRERKDDDDECCHTLMMMNAVILWFCNDEIEAKKRVRLHAINILFLRNSEHYNTNIRVITHFLMAAGGTFDEKLSEVKSSDDGEFSITGFVNTNGPFKPKVNIYHDCDDGIKVIRS
ncbi:unnamed protein product [Anisakis simplex]|uniref:Transthyretin-like family protein n=1 Tax=Anisakis simplex TaxID=6269 RepID=A0A0M3KHW9_ANISI|nr:unnamed protein product [Anisakis simplex]